MRSQNGYTANDRTQVQTWTIAGSRKVALRKGSPGWLLVHFADWFDQHIRDIDAGQLDDWGYAERPIRGGVELSNHASGTALDVDATKWPLGVSPEAYLTKNEITAIRRQLLVYRGAIRWGGDYSGRKDPMHFEVVRDEAYCDAVQAELQRKSPAHTTTTTPAPPTTPTAPPALEEEPVYVAVDPGQTEVIPLPAIPAGRKLFARFGLDEAGGGCNVRVAVGWGAEKFRALPGLDKLDGYTGWLVTGRVNEAELGGSDACLVVTHPRAARNPLGVLLQLR